MTWAVQCIPRFADFPWWLIVPISDFPVLTQRFPIIRELCAQILFSLFLIRLFAFYFILLSVCVCMHAHAHACVHVCMHPCVLYRHVIIHICMCGGACMCLGIHTGFYAYVWISKIHLSYLPQSTFAPSNVESELNPNLTEARSSLSAGITCQLALWISKSLPSSVLGWHTVWHAYVAFICILNI